MKNKINEVWPTQLDSSKIKTNTILKDSSFDPKSKTIETLVEKVSELKDNPFGGVDDLNLEKYIDNESIKNSINYVEKHLPNSELNDTTYIEILMNDIKKYINENINFLKENYDNLDSKEIGIRNGVIHELAKWIKDTDKKIHKFD